MQKSFSKKVSMKKIVTVIAMTTMLAALTLSAGCKKAMITRPEAPAPTAAQQPEAKAPTKAPETITEQKVESVTSKDIASAGTEGKEVKEGMFADVLFDYDKYEVQETYKTEMKAVSAWMMKNGSASLSVEGHCDERGTNEYNLALGDRRAKAVKDYLVSLGIPSSRIDTISYGEEKPACTEQSEACWAKNRRAHFVILMKAGK